MSLAFLFIVLSINFIVSCIIYTYKKQKELETHDPYIVEEPKPFRLYLMECGPEKIKVIKTLRENISLGLTEAKDMVENPPAIIVEVDTQEEAELIKKRFNAVGARVEIQTVQALN